MHLHPRGPCLKAGVWCFQQWLYNLAYRWVCHASWRKKICFVCCPIKSFFALLFGRWVQYGPLRRPSKTRISNLSTASGWIWKKLKCLYDIWRKYNHYSIKNHVSLWVYDSLKILVYIFAWSANVSMGGLENTSCLAVFSNTWETKAVCC